MDRLCALLGLEHGVLQAPMAGAQDATLALAVSNAGALGALPAALLSMEVLRQQLERLGKGTTRPWQVNFFCHSEPAADSQREDAWRRALAPYYTELGIDVASFASAPQRQPFSHEVADVIEPFRPPVVSFHFGLPAPDLLARVRGWGTKVLSSATTVEEAQWLEARGVDAVIAQGLEAGGHRGLFLSADLATQLPTDVLVEAVVHSVGVPVIAAGGIVDARDVTRVRALGAAGVQVGTAFLRCPEARPAPMHRLALEDPGTGLTALTNLFTGRPARGLLNRLMRELGPISPLAPPFPLAGNAIAPLRAAAEERGLADFSPLWAGTGVARCRPMPAAELVNLLSAATTRP